MTTLRNSNIIYCPMCEHWHENNTYCQRNDWYGMRSPLENFLKDLVLFYGYREYNELSDADKYELAGLFIHTSKTPEEVLTENDDLDSITHFLGNALRGSYEDSQIFLHHIKKKVYRHLEPKLISLFENSVDEYTRPIPKHEFFENHEVSYV